MFGEFLFCIIIGNYKSPLDAIKVNFSGGNDYSVYMDERQYDESTNYVWNNLIREVKSKVTRADIKQIFILLEDYFSEENESTLKDDVVYLKSRFNLGREIRLKNTDFEDILRAVYMYYNKAN